MIKLKDSSSSNLKSITDILKLVSYSVEIQDGKIIYLEYDDSALTSIQKTSLTSLLITHNSNLS